MSTTPTPRRIEWQGPEGWTVWADEDGVHLRSAKGDCLEAIDVDRLIDLVRAARVQFLEGHIPAPKPLAREQLREQSSLFAAEYEAKRAARAVYDALAPSDDITPF